MLKFFKTGVATAKAVGVTKSAVSQWPDIIPEKMAYRAQEASKGRLKVDPRVYQAKAGA